MFSFVFFLQFQCPSGWYRDATQHAKQCYECPLGTYGDTSKVGAVAVEDCIDCPTGKHNFLLGATACVDCVKGKASNVVKRIDSVKCDSCSSGMYMDDAGGANCKWCDNGYINVATGGDSPLFCVSFFVFDIDLHLLCFICCLLLFGISRIPITGLLLFSVSDLNAFPPPPPMCIIANMPNRKIRTRSSK